MKSIIRLLAVLALVGCTYAAPTEIHASDYRYSRIRTMVSDGSRRASNAESLQRDADRHFRDAERYLREAERYRRQHHHDRAREYKRRADREHSRGHELMRRARTEKLKAAEAFRRAANMLSRQYGTAAAPSPENG